MSIPNGKNVYGYADAYAKLANFGQQHLLKYYDELDEAQRAALLNQIEQIDFSVVSTNKQPENAAESLRSVLRSLRKYALAEMNSLMRAWRSCVRGMSARCCLRAAWAHGSVRMLRRVRSISESSVNFIFLSAL